MSNKKYKQLYDNYYLHTDNLNYILLKRKYTKNKVVEYDRIGYYGSSMGRLIRGILVDYTLDNIVDTEFDLLIKKLEYIEEILKR